MEKREEDEMKWTLVLVIAHIGIIPESVFERIEHRGIAASRIECEGVALRTMRNGSPAASSGLGYGRRTEVVVSWCQEQQP